MSVSISVKEVYKVGYYHVGISKPNNGQPEMAIVAFYNDKNKAKAVVGHFEGEDAEEKAIAHAEKMAEEKPLGI